MKVYKNFKKGQHFDLFNSFMTKVPKVPKVPIETSPLIFRVNQGTGFYMIGTSVMEEINRCAENQLFLWNRFFSNTHIYSFPHSLIECLQVYQRFVTSFHSLLLARFHSKLVLKKQKNTDSRDKLVCIKFFLNILYIIFLKVIFGNFQMNILTDFIPPSSL